jgi:predicted RNase H-like HicB family nuclease
MHNTVLPHVFTVLIEQDEDGYYVATVPALKSCYTQAKTLPELYPRIQEVIELCLEEEEPTPMKFVAVQQMEFTGTIPNHAQIADNYSRSDDRVSQVSRV